MWCIDMGDRSLRYLVYCNHKGRSRPRSRRTAASEALSERWPSVIRAGSPGITLKMTKTSVATPQRILNEYPILAAIYLNNNTLLKFYTFLATNFWNITKFIDNKKAKIRIKLRVTNFSLNILCCTVTCLSTSVSL